MPLTLATFNVENLLEPRNDVERAAIGLKVAAVAQTLQSASADVAALQEVGPVSLARELATASSLAYGEPIAGTADNRGIRCLLLARLPVLHAQVHTAEALRFPSFRVGDPDPFAGRIPLRRGVVHAVVRAPTIGPVHVFVVHFKSRIAVPLRDPSGVPTAEETSQARAEGVARSLAWRAAEALHVRGLVDDVLRANPSAHVVVAGDMNDVPESPVIELLCGSGEGALTDCATRIDAPHRFSVLRAGRGQQIDYVLATARLFDRVTDARFFNEHLAQGDAESSGRATAGQSDHAALVVRFD